MSSTQTSPTETEDELSSARWAGETPAATAKERAWRQDVMLTEKEAGGGGNAGVGRTSQGAGWVLRTFLSCYVEGGIPPVG